MKKRCVAILLAISMVFTGISIPTQSYKATEVIDSQEDEIVNIPDEVLFQAIKAQCDNDRDGNITKSEMKTLSYLSIRNTSTDTSETVSDLTGLEYATNLSTLYIRSQNITKIDALSQLTNLQTLNLEGNQISDISALANLENLTELNLEGNQISNISVLAKLKNLKWLYMNNNDISDISALSGMKELRRLELGENQISDISTLTEFTKIYNLDLSKNKIEDISTLATLKNLNTLSLNDNQIKDATVLSQFKSLLYANLDNNQITKFPEIPLNAGLHSLSFEGNPLNDIVNAKQFFDVKVPYGVYVYASPEYVTQELQFESFFDTSERKMYVGNVMALGSSKTYFRTDEDVEITYQTEDTDIVTVTERGRITAQKTGIATITATCGSIEKTFIVTVTEAEQTIEEEKEEVPEVLPQRYETASILDEKDLLWGVNHNGSDVVEAVHKDAKNYVAKLIYSSDRLSYWNNYVVLDSNNDLYYVCKNDENASYQKKLIGENAVDFQAYIENYGNGKYIGRIYYLTSDGTLYQTNSDGEQILIAEDVKTYSVCYYNILIFTNSGDVIYNDSVIASDVGECVFYPNTYAFLTLKDGVATCYSTNGAVNAQLEDVAQIGTQERDGKPFYAVKTDGTIEELKNIYSNAWNTYEKDTVAFPIKEDVYISGVLSYAIDANDVLWRLANDTYEKLAENVTYMNRLYGYVADNTRYSWEGEVSLFTDIKEYDDTYYLSTDGTVYEVFADGNTNKILTDVVDIVSSNSQLYMVRKDASVWKYNGYEDNVAIAYMLKSGSSIIMGDISGDGNVEVKDVLTVLHSISGSQTLSAEQHQAADIDGDGSVTVKDILRMLHYISGASSAL